MKTFDYEKAWQDLALPEFKKLPNAVLTLVEETAIIAADLGQDWNCCMIWPDDNGKLRELFERLDSATLARAAHVVYFYGHWRPAASIAGNAPVIAGGAHWKFSHYADQVLRARFNISARDSASKVSLQIHEGTIRVCYSSPDMWTWHEVAPATEEGMRAAGEIADSLRRNTTQPRRSDRDEAAHKFFEEIKKTEAWPDFSTAGYTVEESELELRRAARMPKPNKTKLILEINQAFDKELSDMTTERDGMLWLVEHDLPKDNCIYYNHMGRFCFGWRNPIAADAKAQLLERLAGFPFPYDVN